MLARVVAISALVAASTVLVVPAFATTNATAPAGIVSSESGENNTWVVDFARITTQLSQNYPDTYASAFVNPDQASGWVAFTGTAPAAARDLLTQLGGVEIRENAAVSERELHGVAATLHERLSLAFATSPIATYPDPATTSIVVLVQNTDPSTSDAALPSDVESAAQSIITSLNASTAISVRVEVTDSAVTVQE